MRGVNIIPEITRADTGLGTTFERWALNCVLARLQARSSLHAVFEGPDDGMTGIAGLNSLTLGLQSAQVTLLLPEPARADFARSVWAMHAPEARPTIQASWDGRRLPFDDDTFDLAWNFNVMAQQTDPGRLLSELCRISRKYVLVCVPNRSNYSFWLHQLHHRVAHQPWPHGQVELMQPAPWRKMLAERGFETREVFWLDCPWWPDVVDPGQLIADFFPFLKGAVRRARPENRYRWEAQDLPYYRPDIYPQVHRQMESLAFFENSRLEWLKRLFAHHTGILAERDRCA